MKKPVVRIRDWKLGGNRLFGKVIDHPRFDEGEEVVTSRVEKVETKNTIYILEGPPK